MLQKWLFLIFAIWLAGCAPAAVNSQTAVTPTPENTPSPEPEIDAETKALAADFIALRSEMGQFNGGSWNEAVDQWQGRKHTTMMALGDRLGNGRFSCSQLTDLLHPPDHTVQGGDPLYELIQTTPIFEAIQDETAQFLVYEWRGTHDFLFFVCEDGRITAADWWYAGE